MTEKRGIPLYSAVKRGLRVLDVLPGSNAQSMGIMRGDIILSINNMDIQSEEGIGEALKDFPVYTWIRVLRDEEEKDPGIQMLSGWIQHAGNNQRAQGEGK